MGIFKAYDIRGIYGKDLTDAIFYKIARAYVRFIGAKKVVVARDCRTSGDALFAAFTKGVMDEGCDVVDIGLASTPMSYFANGTLKVDGSVMITASHNTREWNGCKLCRADAVPISGATGIKDIEKMVAEMPENEPPRGVGELTKTDVSAAYAAHVQEFAHLAHPLHLAFDFANGMGIAESVAFKGSAITYDALYGEYDGNFPNHNANPLEHETLKDLQTLLRANPGKYAFGVAFDGDADRAGFLDEKGEIIPMDFVTALIARDLLTTHPGATCLYDLRSSRVCEEVIAAAGGKPMMSRVGHSFIKAQMRGRAVGPLLLQCERHRRIVVHGDLRAREHRLQERQAAFRNREAAAQVRAIGRNQLEDGASAGGGARGHQGRVGEQGESLRTGRRHGRRLGDGRLVGQRPHEQHRTARPPEPGRSHKGNHGGEA